MKNIFPNKHILLFFIVLTLMGSIIIYLFQTNSKEKLIELIFTNETLSDTNVTILEDNKCELNRVGTVTCLNDSDITINHNCKEMKIVDQDVEGTDIKFIAYCENLLQDIPQFDFFQTPIMKGESCINKYNKLVYYDTDIHSINSQDELIKLLAPIDNEEKAELIVRVSTMYLKAKTFHNEITVTKSSDGYFVTLYWRKYCGCDHPIFKTKFSISFSGEIKLISENQIGLDKGWTEELMCIH